MRNFVLDVLAGLLLIAGGCAAGPKVRFMESADKIDVKISGKHVTSYIYRDDLTKPVLFPVRTLSGIEVNRGFPLVKKEGESEDHPHHAGLFFTYDEVNGEGFWNNITSPPRIKHVKTRSMKPGEGEGFLSMILHWIGNSGEVLLEEEREMIFSAGEEGYAIDFTMRLKALRQKVVFEDTKEGMFAIRVAQWLKEKGGTGEYLSAKGDRGAKEVWGSRAAWVALQGEKDGKPVGIAILHHPSSVNHPTFWHARDYGLFAANPLGQAVFEKTRGKKDPRPFRLTLEKGESALFRFRVLVYEGRKTKENLQALFEEW